MVRNNYQLQPIQERKQQKKLREWFPFPLHSFVWIYPRTEVYWTGFCTVISWDNQVGGDKEVPRDPGSQDQNIKPK